MADVQKTVLGIAIALIMVATIFVIGVNLLGNENFVSDYSETVILSDSAVRYLGNNELLDGSLLIRNATISNIILTDNVTVDYTLGKLTCAADMNIYTGYSYTVTYQKDKVDTTVQTIIVTVLSTIAAIVIARRMLKG